MKRRTLTQHLLAWTLGALCVVWASFIAIGYKTGEHEADELTDGHLASLAALIVDYSEGQFSPPARSSTPSGSAMDLKAHDYQQSMSVIVWDGAGRLITQRGDAPLPGVAPREGFATLTLGEPRQTWRAFSRWNDNHTRMVTVLLSERERDDLASDIAQQMMEPGLWLLPVIALVLGLAIYRGLAPLYALSREILALDIHRAEPLQVAGRHQEFDAAVGAINTLVERYNLALRREQALADEFAHELRTPLASLSLQARALRGADAQVVDEGLARIEADALRAGTVLSHLLALARASRSEIAQAAQDVDLDSLVRNVVAEMAPLAHKQHHEIGVSGIGPLHVQGHPVLLEMALRNLVENAVVHTPAGTRVEVQVDSAANWVQVCDDATPGTPVGGPVNPARTSGTGLGHRVVRKVAQVHGAAFDEVPAPEGFTRSYRLTFAEPVTKDA
ncbi:ATP-binding protein [Caenimonas sp. SL110]|uniref:ATP-binding protein n=1 Tax=Caenimonas sp. SL110 TaxID=1450524 RepID=UPI000652D886|nr:ATP-binding protein [Caenimonas sp. SL110]